MDIATDAVTWVFLLAGSFFAVVGGIGIVRLPDFYSRIHGAGITDTMGAGLILVGLMIQSGWSLVTFKLFMILALLFLTGPTSTHALANAALVAGLSVDEQDETR